MSRLLLSFVLAHDLDHQFVPTVPVPRQALPSDRPRQMSTVLVADCILRAVETSDGSALAKMAIAAGRIHSPFLAPDVSGHTGGKDPVSGKKLEPNGRPLRKS
jgi:hypothetical protein